MDANASEVRGHPRHFEFRLADRSRDVGEHLFVVRKFGSGTPALFAATATKPQTVYSLGSGSKPAFLPRMLQTQATIQFPDCLIVGSTSMTFRPGGKPNIASNFSGPSSAAA